MRKYVGLLVVAFSIIFGGESIATSDKPSQQPSSVFSPALVKEADDYLNNLKKGYQPSVTEAEAIRRKVDAAKSYYNNSSYEAIFDLERVILDDPKDYQAWILLADNCSRKEFRDDKDKVSKAEYAWYQVYKLANDPLDKVVCLKRLSSLDPQTYQAPYLEALGKVDKKKVEDRYAEMTSGYPKIFGVYDIDVPEKSDVGTVCLSFSRPLLKLKSFAYEDYISIAPDVKDKSVVAKGNRLCISGLAFGGSYKITLKKGLAGEGGYKLAEDKTVDVIIKHRKPSIVFRERGYILPSKGPQLLPLKAINVSTVNIKVYQIPSWNLPQVLNQGDFPGQLYPYKLDQIKAEQGELIAQGTFDSKGNMDETVLRGLPLDKILGDRLQPGIYVVQGHTNDTATYSEDDNATQWLVVSDIGLSSFTGPDGLHVTARSLSTAKELAGVDISVIARNGRNLGTVKTDKNGHVQFDKQLMSGKDSNQPLFVQAMTEGKDFTFISFRKEGFDFSDRGVKGRDPVQNADAYIYTERGIYRPGDKVSITGLLRDSKGKAMTGVPLTYKIMRPDGVEAFTEVIQDTGTGAYSYVMESQNGVFTGLWTVSAYIDPNGPMIGQTTFKIEDFIPPRVEVKALIKQKVVHALEVLNTDVIARYFYGPWASNLKAEGLVELVEADEPFEKWKDYKFGLEEESWTPLKFKAEATSTNDKGEATLQSNINIKPDTTKLLSAKSVATVFEAGGRGRTVAEQTLFWHQPYAIGISAQFKDRTSPGDGNASFLVIAVDENGALRAESGLKYTLYEETYGFTWFRSGGAWNFEKTIDDKVISNGSIDLKGDAPSQFNVPVTYGYYRLEVMDAKTGVATSYRFHAGWGGLSEVPDRPDMIEMSLDKASYKPGEKAVLSLVSPFDGELEIVALDDKKYTSVHHGKAVQKGTKVEINLTSEILQKSGTYLMATVYRPGDAKSEKVASRAVGLIWVDAKESMPKLSVSVKAPAVVQPEKEFKAKICVNGGAKKVYATVAVVDEAILQLTDFKTPDPFNYIFDQIKLAYTIRDSYGYLINPFGARPGDFKVGGDGLSQKALAKLAARTFKTVSFFSGVISDFKDGSEEGCSQEAEVSFTLPEFSGQVRVMAVVWDADSTGSSESKVTVRDDLETYIALPRFLSPGDETSLILDAQNLTDKEGTFKLSLHVDGEVALSEPFEKSITLKKDELVHLPIGIKAKDVGVGKLVLKVEGDGLKLEKHWEIAVRSSAYAMSKVVAGVLKSGESVTLNAGMRSEFKPGSGANTLSLGSVPTYGAARLRREMRAYPYGCLEQLSSRLTAEVYAKSDQRDATKVEDILTQLVSLQLFDGPFSLWSASGYAEPWLSMYALDVLSKAQIEKMEVSPVVINRGMDWVKERARMPTGNDPTNAAKCYAFYILAKLGQGSLGMLKYYADNNQDQLTHRDDLAFIAAAFALYGDASAAQAWFDRAINAQPESAKDRSYFQSWISDTAILVTLMAETTSNHPKFMELTLQLADMVSQNQYLSTFEKGWLLRASTALQKMSKPIKASIGEQQLSDSLPTSVEVSKDQLQSGLVFKNDGSAPLTYSFNMDGEPLDMSKVSNKGFNIRRELYTLSGQQVDMNQIKSGDLMIVVIKGELDQDDTHQVVVLDLLPSGFEIEKVKFDESYLKNNFEWIGELTELSRVEKRDDRYMASFKMDGRGAYAMTYFVRALNPGQYKMPAVSVESMYRPELQARGPEGVLTIKP